MEDGPIEAATPPPDSTQPVENVPANGDLSSEIERSVDRAPADWVRCVRVFGDYYRCNWWSRKGEKHSGQDFDWGGLTTDHVRQSRFLKATTWKGQLVLEEVTQSLHRSSAAQAVAAEPGTT